MADMQIQWFDASIQKKKIKILYLYAAVADTASSSFSSYIVFFFQLPAILLL
jgi:hypothetical protein